MVRRMSIKPRKICFPRGCPPPQVRPDRDFLQGSGRSLRSDFEGLRPRYGLKAQPTLDSPRPSRHLGATRARSFDRGAGPGILAGLPIRLALAEPRPSSQLAGSIHQLESSFSRFYRRVRLVRRVARPDRSPHRPHPTPFDLPRAHHFDLGGLGLCEDRSNPSQRVPVLQAHARRGSATADQPLHFVALPDCQRLADERDFRHQGGLAPSDLGRSVASHRSGRSGHFGQPLCRDRPSNR